MKEFERDTKKHWRITEKKYRGAIPFGAVYVCPYCDGESPDDFRYCPNCGMYVGRGIGYQQTEV